MCTIKQKLDSFFDSYAPSLSSSLRENRLERMEILLKALGNPEKTFQSIHIAGSKGKGTTATFLSSLLTRSGRKSGLYLSPHVRDVRERFTLSSSFFSDALYLRTLEELESVLSSFSLPSSLGPEKPTTFELYTAYAYLLFRNAGLKWAVIETGMGGRLDATNTITPVASVFVRIEMEHTRILGSTLSLIAKEKAGIMCPGVPAFSLPQKKEAMDVLKKEGEEKSVSSFTKIECSEEWITENIGKRECLVNIGGKTLSFLYPSPFSDTELIDLHFALSILNALGLLDNIEKEETIDFNSGFSLPARFQKKSIRDKNGKSLSIIFDGAHTPESMAHLYRNLTLSGEKLSALIFSSAEDKDHSALFAPLSPLFSSVIVTGLGEWKKCRPQEIFQDLKKEYPQKKIEYSPSSSGALNSALRESDNGDTIVVAGSFYLADRIMETIGEEGLWEE